jgi:hypothetical protein
MAKPNEMPKKANPVRQQVVSNLIETRPASWTKKVLAKDADGKETVESVKVERRELKFSFALNMSEENVERLAQRWL